jgi:hypothetical protein
MDHLKLVSVPTQSSMKNGSSGRVGGFQLLAPTGGLTAAVEKQQRPAFIFSPASQDKGSSSSITAGNLKFNCLPGRAEVASWLPRIPINACGSSGGRQDPDNRDQHHGT